MVEPSESGKLDLNTIDRIRNCPHLPGTDLRYQPSRGCTQCRKYDRDANGGERIGYSDHPQRGGNPGAPSFVGGDPNVPGGVVQRIIRIVYTGTEE